MDNEIILSKKTLLVFGALLAAIIIAGFVFFSAQPDIGKLKNNNARPNLQSSSDRNALDSANTQEIYLQATGSGYDKSELYVKKGIPVRLHFTAYGAGCGSQLILEGFNVNLVSNGETKTAEFTPAKAGTYQYHCGMYMFRGQLVVS